MESKMKCREAMDEGHCVHVISVLSVLSVLRSVRSVRSLPSPRGHSPFAVKIASFCVVAGWPSPGAQCPGLRILSWWTCKGLIAGKMIERWVRESEKQYFASTGTHVVAGRGLTGLGLKHVATHQTWMMQSQTT